MHFTIVFESHESYDLSYGLVFAPCPVWKKGDKQLINLHPDRPDYEAGDLERLLEHENIESLLVDGRRNAVVIIHDTGHGTETCLSTLTKDLSDNGFSVVAARFGCRYEERSIQPESLRSQSGSTSSRGPEKIEEKSDEYSDYFAGLFASQIPLLLSSGWERDKNQEAPSSFGENHLRKFIQNSKVNGQLICPYHLEIEKSVRGDWVDAEPGGRSHGGVDYFLSRESQPGGYALTELLATCEVGGPTREKLLLGSKTNWYPKILRDVEKQLWRAINAPNGAHYIALIINSGRTSEPLAKTRHILTGMTEQIGSVELVQCCHRLISDSQYLIIYRVLPL